jgi:hypothetical protein
MNAAGEIAVTLAGLIGFGRLFLADEGASHRLSGFLILAGLVGKVALSRSDPARMPERVAARRSGKMPPRRR